jgi:hypothetical protein
MTTALLFASALADAAPWWKTVLALLAVAAAIGAAIWFSVFLIRRIEKVVWRRQTVIRHLRFQNSGNVPGVIQFAAAAAADDLSFQYLLDGRPLALQITPPPEPEVMPVVSQPGGQVGTPTSAAGAVQAGPVPDVPGGKKAAAAKVKEVKAESKKALGKSRNVVSILGTLGGLIPGEWGKALKDRSTALQAEVQKAGQAIEMPEVKLQAAKSLQGQVQSLGPAKPAPQPAAVAAETPAPVAAGDVPASGGLAGAPSQPPAPRPVPASPFTSYVQTTAIPPEGALVVELRIEPRARYRTAEYTYWLLSSQVEQEATPAGRQLEVQRLQQSVCVKGLSWGYLLLTFLLDSAVLCLNALWVVLFIDWLSRLIA